MTQAILLVCSIIGVIVFATTDYTFEQAVGFTLQAMIGLLFTSLFIR